MEWLLSHVPSRGNTPPPQQEHAPSSAWQVVHPVSHHLDPTFMYGGYGYTPYNPSTPFGWPITPPQQKSADSSKFPANRSSQDPTITISEELLNTPNADLQRRPSLDEIRSKQLQMKSTAGAAATAPASPAHKACKDDCLLASSPSKQMTQQLQSMPSSQSMPCLSLLTGSTPRQRRVDDDRKIGLAAA